MDIDSSFTETISKKDFSFGDVCDYIVSRGSPIIIGTDKSKAPDHVKKLASTFGARLYAPESNLGVEEKESLTKKYRTNDAKQTEAKQNDARSASIDIASSDFASSSLVKNDHERDALAAALHAKKKFSAFLQKIDRVLEKKGFEGRRSDVKELLIKGEVGNIEQALKLLAPTTGKDIKIVTKLVDSRSVLELRKRLDQQQKENVLLKKRTAELEQRIKELENELKQEEEFRKKVTKFLHEKSKPKITKESIDRSTLVKQLEKDYYVLVAYEPGVDVKDKIVVADKRTDIQAIAKKSPKAIISETFQKSFIKTEDVDVPIIVKDTITIKNVEGFLVVEKSEIEKAIEKSFISWLQDYKNRYEKD